MANDQEEYDGEIKDLQTWNRVLTKEEKIQYKFCEPDVSHIGDMYMNEDGAIKIWNGKEWLTVSPPSSVTLAPPEKTTVKIIIPPEKIDPIDRFRKIIEDDSDAPESS